MNHSTYRCTIHNGGLYDYPGLWVRSLKSEALSPNSLLYNMYGRRTTPALAVDERHVTKQGG
jgi:hypothetical protein